MGFQEECGVLRGASQGQQLLGQLTRQMQTALRAIHMVKPAEDRKTLGNLRVRLTQPIRSSIQAFCLWGGHSLGDHVEGTERYGELQLELPPCLTLRHALQECVAPSEMRQGFLVGSPLEGLCAGAAPVSNRLWIQAGLAKVMRQERRLGVSLL